MPLSNVSFKSRLTLNWRLCNQISEREYTDSRHNNDMMVESIMLVGYINNIKMVYYDRHVEYSRHNGMIPRLYVPEWKMDMKNRSVILEVIINNLTNN